MEQHLLYLSFEHLQKLGNFFGAFRATLMGSSARKDARIRESKSAPGIFCCSIIENTNNAPDEG